MIHFLPTKTADSSGVAVDFRISPEIDAVLARIVELDGHQKIGNLPVIHATDGSAYGVTGLRSAFDRAAGRVGLDNLGYTVKSIRAKALTDGDGAGYDMKALQTAAAHTDESTIRIYLKIRRVLVSDVRLKLPKSA